MLSRRALLAALSATAVRHTYGSHPAQFGELSLPTGRRRTGTVVIVHGGFWRAQYDLSLGRPLAADLVGRGYAVWNLEYRRVGDSGGWPATFEDIAAGVDLLDDLRVDTSAVVAIGHSAGGHLATWAAGRSRLPSGAVGEDPRVAVTGVVSQAGVLALVRCAEDGVGGSAAPDLMGGPPAAVPERYRVGDPLAAVPISAPVLCVHSKADQQVPYAQSVSYVDAATKAGAKATLHETHGDHFTLIDPNSPDWAVVTDALPGLLAA
jgi:acetyl esterase/lipase